MHTRLVDVTLTLDTNAYTAGDVLAATQLVENAVRDKNQIDTLESLVVIDEDDQGAAFDIYFFSANSALGTENAAPNISDADARNLLAIVSVGTGDYKDVGGAKVAFFRDLGILLKPATDTTNIYVGVVNGAGTPTYTAAGLKLRLGIHH